MVLSLSIQLARLHTQLLMLLLSSLCRQGNRLLMLRNLAEIRPGDIAMLRTKATNSVKYKVNSH